MWKYQELLNQNLQILITILIGYICVFTRALDQKTDIHSVNKVIFYVLLPSAVLFALGLNTNLRDGNVWRFVGGFLLLRALCLAVVWAYHGLFRKQSLAYVTIQWMVTCWVSTVVLGIPLLIATLGPQYGSLGAVAAISSFIFQLPLMLIFLEGSSDTDGFEERSVKKKVVVVGSAGVSETRGAGVSKEIEAQRTEPEEVRGMRESAEPGTRDHGSWYRLSFSKAQARYVGIKMAKNPILWAIVIGFILSITTLGPRYLSMGNPPLLPNCDYAVGAGFIQLTLKYFAACTEPIALLAVGMFLYSKNPIACGVIPSIAYMVVKLILVPGLMVGCAFAVGLSGAEGRAAVLLASLPVSPTSYTMSDKYGIGRDISESNVFWGNLLVLPTTIAWNAFMDGIDLFRFRVPPSISSLQCE
jgi:predicted permease